MDAQPHEGFVAVGLVSGARGVRGEMKVLPLTDFPQRFLPGSVLWAAGERWTVRDARTHRGVLFLELAGIDSKERANLLRGALLEVPEEELPPLEDSQYFQFQVVGMAVEDVDGNPLGRVEEVLATGANDVYVVRDAEGELLIPAIDTVVKEVDVDGRRMRVELMAGLERRRLKRPARR